MEIPILNLKAQYQELQEEIEAAVLDVMRSGHYVLGPNLLAFEEEAAKFLGAKHAVGCANGSDALYLALLALDIKPGDEVITTPFTYVATAEAITQIGASPVFADINLDTYNIDPAEIESKINSKTRAILVVHLYGQACDMDSIMRIAKKHNLKVIEDTAQSFGTRFQSNSAGTIGDIGTYSFYPTKNLSCAGDGGMLTTNSAEISERLKRIRTHGSSRRYYHDELGVNSRLDEVQAAILRIKLKHIENWNLRRAKIAKLYNQALQISSEANSELEFIEPAIQAGSTHIYHQYTFRIKYKNQSETAGLGRSRDLLRDHLKAQALASEIYYPLPLHMQKLYSELGHAPEDFANSFLASQSILCLPIYPELSDEQVQRVCTILASLAEFKIYQVS